MNSRNWPGIGCALLKSDARSIQQPRVTTSHVQWKLEMCNNLLLPLAKATEAKRSKCKLLAFGLCSRNVRGIHLLKSPWLACVQVCAITAPRQEKTQKTMCCTFGNAFRDPFTCVSTCASGSSSRLWQNGNEPILNMQESVLKKVTGKLPVRTIFPEDLEDSSGRLLCPAVLHTHALSSVVTKQSHIDPYCGPSHKL